MSQKLIILMEKKLDQLYQKTKNSLRICSRNPNKAIEDLKAAQQQLKQIKIHLPLQQQSQGLETKIIHLQIIILNNLACAYNQKGKYKASLFNLQLVTELQKTLISNQSYQKSQNLQKSLDIYLQQWKQNPEILHQVATTHSNLCAVYSQMGNHERSVKEIKQAIKFLEINPSTKTSDALAVFYYNYAVQLEHIGQINEAHKKACKGLGLAASKPEIKAKIQQCIQNLQEKMKKRQKRIGEYLASKYKSPFFDHKDPIKSVISANYLSRKGQNSKVIDKNLSAYTTKLPSSLKKIPRDSQYPSVYYPKKFSKSKRQSPLKSNTLILESRKKVQSLYGKKYEIPDKNRCSLAKKKDSLNYLLRSIGPQD